ncbi:MAG: hypothetical protein EBY26_04185, partial [Microbacteriaceae bacterium]|nr:hypothetical protein [Microbacteriaceae bacterium]
DAIEKAVERNDSAKRPMFKGVVSSKEKDARRILTYILKEVVGTPSEPGEKLVFCVPAQPVDQEDDDFDVGYHEDVIVKLLSEVGYSARAINEAEALCYSELDKDDYTGVALSWGAGMVNVCVMLNGEPVVTFSTTKSGDWVEVLNTDAEDFGGSGVGNLGKITANLEPSHGQPHSASISVPPLGAVWFKPAK